jgi:hypothetical protein
VLASGTRYALVGLLGALGAQVSFAIGSMRRSAEFRIYELASGNFATLATRVLVGSAGAVIVVVAIEVRVLATPLEWTFPAAVAAGFSERLVRRIVESLSTSAEDDQGSDLLK